jgi:FkbM family methyltransferase
MLRGPVKALARKMGYDIVTFRPDTHPQARRMKLLELHGVDLIIDAGANTGQYAQQMRRLGYRGRIVSFEPLSHAYRELFRNAVGDSLWHTVNVALGDTDGTAVIHRSQHSPASSLLTALPTLVEAVPPCQVIAHETVEVRRLDSICEAEVAGARSPYLKMDCQGFERRVLAGAERLLRRCAGIQLEVSLVPLYEGETLLEDMLPYVQQQGFTLMSIEPGFSHPASGQLYQVNLVFYRNRVQRDLTPT